MIKNIKIDNFKSLNGFSMDFNDLTVVIGNNSAGKSSLLQALVFLRYCCTSSTDQYMMDRSVDVDAIVSKLPQTLKRIISFEAEFRFGDDKVVWKLGMLTEKKTNSIRLQSESVSVWSDFYGKLLFPSDEDIVLSYSSAKAWRRKAGAAELESIAVGSYGCSQIQFIDKKKGRNDYPYLWAIKEFFRESEPLDLLAPQDMRKSGRGSTRTLGINGRQLPALINQLSAMERDALVSLIRSDLPNVRSIQAVVHGKPGWAHLETCEDFNGREIRIPANGISDGTLRLIALYSLSYINRVDGMILLDEIEDGINTKNLENVCNLLRSYTESRGQQVLVTTHSTVMLDYVDPADIRYLYRDESGNTVCRNFTDSAEITGKLEYLYPGELILSSENGELERIMAEADTEYGEA